ncbi:MAG TPA: alpha/beta hydrolase [Mycobacteriales bacterium]|nr:alpha/beta hydrolase [Mycobacteriales bacterium]
MRIDPGRDLTEHSVTIKGRRVRTVQAGTGEPLVVFESGLGAPAELWVEVQRQVSATTATLAYDRAGVGGSKRVKGPRLFADINADLEAVLTEIRYDGPLILVGQSWGGPIVRAFAQQTRRPVAGVVLVDGTNSHAMTTDLGEALSAFFSLLSLASRIGLHRRWRGKMLKGTTAGLAPEDQLRVKTGMLRSSAQRGGADEAKGLVSELDNLAGIEDRGFPAGTPVTFMSATVAEPGTEETRERFVARQKAEAESGGHRHVVVDTSRHDIHMQEPALVADEILMLVERHRTVTPAG